MQSNLVHLFQKEHLLTRSKSFCMLPWIHIYADPIGQVMPCCIAQTVVGNSIESNLESLVNSDEMKKLRVDMLNGRLNSACAACHAHEKQGIPSSRQNFNRKFGHYFSEGIKNTDNFGHVKEFKMAYFDFRFSNICNFKCRTCGAPFSTQWEQEDLKRNLPYARIYPKNNNERILNEIISHIPHMEFAYFAGGEPLITEEHYILLEEMIRQQRTDIKLSYNSNISNLKFKGKDILALWKQFKHPIELSASIDHYGDRAEYIRNGTNWSTVESNLKMLAGLDNISLSLNSVVSIFNYATFDEFYSYLIDAGIYHPGRNTFGIYCMVSPEHLTSQVLPVSIKEIANPKMHHLVNLMNQKEFSKNQVGQVENAINWTNANAGWDIYKEYFQIEVKELDVVRGEDFVKVFPELASLLE